VSSFEFFNGSGTNEDSEHVTLNIN